MFYVYMLGVFIVAGALVSFTDWRKGVYFMIIAAAVQDPIRKVTPGVPVWLVMTSVPVWGMMILGAFLSDRHRFYTEFAHYSPKLMNAFRFFTLMLIPATLISLTYGRGSYRVTLVGLFAYASPMLGLMLGFSFPRRVRDIERVMVFFCLITAVLMTGGVLEQLGMFPEWRTLGTEILEMRWIRERWGYVVDLVAGFYRSPDIMGWHAASLTMLALILALHRPGAQRLFWVVLAGWGSTGLMLCGRRKMALMIPVWGLLMLWIYWRRRHSGKIALLGVIATVFVLIGYGMQSEAQVGGEVATYYFRDTSDVFERIYVHGYQAVRVSFRQVGFFGSGLGTATQGTHRIAADRPRTWQEGGLSKIAAELGIFGFTAFMILAWRLLRVMYMNVKNVDPRGEGVIFAGLAAVFFANAASFVVSGQIFGDPFINCFFALLAGFSLSQARLHITPDRHVWATPMPLPRALVPPRYPWPPHASGNGTMDAARTAEARGAPADMPPPNAGDPSESSPPAAGRR